MKEEGIPPNAFLSLVPQPCLLSLASMDKGLGVAERPLMSLHLCPGFAPTRPAPLADPARAGPGSEWLLLAFQLSWLDHLWNHHWLSLVLADKEQESSSTLQGRLWNKRWAFFNLSLCMRQIIGPQPHPGWPLSYLVEDVCMYFLGGGEEMRDS